MYTSANQPPLSPSQVYGGVTTPLLGAAPAVTNADIKKFVDDVLATPKTDVEKAATIRNAMVQYNVSASRIATATGYSLQQVNDYLGFSSPSGLIQTVAQSTTQSNPLSTLFLAAIAYLFLS